MIVHMEPPPGPFPVERNTRPYAYVCHASADAYRVYEIIRELHLAGFRIWYFEDGMKADLSWPQQNADAIDGCRVFIIFTSAVSVSRPDTMDELTMAHNANKPLLQIQLEHLTMPRGMALFLERPQAIMAWRKDRQSVVSEAAQFLGAHGLEPSHDAVEDRSEAVPPPSKVVIPPRSRGKRPVSISDTFANRVGESELLATAVGRQLARLNGDEAIEEGVFPNILVFHGRSGLGKTGLSIRLEMWATGKPLEHSEWGLWPHRPVTPVRWNFNDSAGGVRLDSLLVILREALAGTGMTPMAFDLALASYLEAARPGTDASGLSLSGGAADGVLRSLQRIAVELTLSVPGVITASEVRRIRDGVIGVDDRRSLERFDGFPALLDELRQLPQGSQSRDLAADVMYMLTQELAYIRQVLEPPVLVFFLDAFERLQRQESPFAQAAITSLIAAMPYGLFVITSQDALDWHEPNRTYLEHCGPHAWPGLATGDGQHMLNRLSDEDTRHLYMTHRDINRWHMSEELVGQLVKRSNGWPMHIEAVMQLTRSLENQQPGRSFSATDLDRDLPQVVMGLMETLSARERNAFRAACVLPFFDVELAAAVMAGDCPDRDGAVAGAIRHALVESNPGSLYPYRVHDEIREQVRRDRETPGFWGDGDWRAAAQRGIDEAKRRVTASHSGLSDSAEMEATALAIRLAYEWSLPIDDLPLLVTEGPTIGGLSPLLPMPSPSHALSEAGTLLSFIHAIALPYSASIDALASVYAAQSPVAQYAGRWRAYRLRDIRRYDEALEQLRELIIRFPENTYNKYQYAITLRQCRRFHDGLKYVANHTPDRLAEYSRAVERQLGILDIDPSLSTSSLEAETSKRFRAEREVTELRRRSQVEWVAPEEVQPILERAISRRSRVDQRQCLAMLGYTCLDRPSDFEPLLESIKRLMRSYDSVSDTIVHLLALRALLTGAPDDARSAHDAFDGGSFRGSGWISVEVWLEQLGYPLPQVPTQWTIPYDQVRSNWLSIADGIIERAKAHASESFAPSLKSLLAGT